jgi:hypothetical protein
MYIGMNQIIDTLLNHFPTTSTFNQISETKSQRKTTTDFEMFVLSPPFQKDRKAVESYVGISRVCFFNGEGTGNQDKSVLGKKNADS